jgi:protein-S-isoprenylcysteine O-methyltransferase Ste14
VHRFPRWLFVPTFIAGIALAHAAAPWAIAGLGVRHGWAAGRPGAANLSGVVLVSLAAGALAWVAVVVLNAAPAGWRFERLHDASTWSPQPLLVGGPYKYSRNPMYLAELTLWLGWSLFYGSVPLTAATLVLWAAVAYGQIPREERALLARMDRPYLEYREHVPRWLGRVRP